MSAPGVANVPRPVSMSVVHFYLAICTPNGEAIAVLVEGTSFDHVFVAMLLRHEARPSPERLVD